MGQKGAKQCQTVPNKAKREKWGKLGQNKPRAKRNKTVKNRNKWGKAEPKGVKWGKTG